MKIYLVTKRAKPTCKQLVLVAKYILKPTVLFFQVSPIPIGPPSCTNSSPENQVIQGCTINRLHLLNRNCVHLHIKDQGCPHMGWLTDTPTTISAKHKYTRRISQMIPRYWQESVWCRAKCTVGQGRIEVNRTVKNRAVGIAVLNYAYWVPQPYPESETGKRGQLALCGRGHLGSVANL